MLIRTAILALLVSAAPALAEEIACEGAFAIDSSEARLIEIFGADNVVTGMVPGPEGEEMLATRVFPGDRRKGLEIVWWDETGRKDPSYIELGTKLTAPGGLRVGLTIDEVAALNGEPFSLSGFGWDYGGYAGFESGALSDLPGGCIASVRFGLDDYPEGVDVDSIIGDQTVESTNPLLDEVGARIQSVSVGYPHYDFRD